MTTPTEAFDAVIVGTGQAGRPLAAALHEAGWTVAIVERERVGGSCVLRGCTPSKTMIASARIAHLARRAADFGVHTSAVRVDMTEVRRRKRGIVDAWSEAAEKDLEEREGVELIRGEARFVGERTIEVDASGGRRRLRAPKVFLNPGARPAIPSVPGLRTTSFLDSTAALELSEVPEELVVLGGGLIGVELGQMFRRFGSRVTLLERGDRLLPREDEDVSKAVQEILEEDGVKIRTSTEVASVEPTPEGGTFLRIRGGGSDDTLWGSHLLLATGRVPNTDALTLEATGLTTDDAGHIPVNDRLETRVEGIWAMGDVTGGPAFTHLAYDDFRVIRANLLGSGGGSTRNRVPCYTVFTDPQLGRVGLTEAEARSGGREVRVATLPMSRVARAVETGETRGFMKAVVDPGDRTILGAAILGAQGGEVASVLQMAMIGGLPFETLRDSPLSHPTFAESLNNLFTDF